MYLFFDWMQVTYCFWGSLFSIVRNWGMTGRSQDHSIVVRIKWDNLNLAECGPSSFSFFWKEAHPHMIWALRQGSVHLETLALKIILIELISADLKNSIRNSFCWVRHCPLSKFILCISVERWGNWDLEIPGHLCVNMVLTTLPSCFWGTSQSLLTDLSFIILIPWLSGNASFSSCWTWLCQSRINFSFTLHTVIWLENCFFLSFFLK